MRIELQLPLVVGDPARALRGGALPSVACLLLCALPGSAFAYSDPTLYPESTDIGGGGGRWFTGSSADGYGCDVCHTGGSGPDLSITGLPTDGFTPGQHYEISIQWPPTAQLALMAEFTDEQRHGAGTLTLPRPEATKEYERCALDEGGQLPTGLFAAESGRNLFSVIDCGAKSTRFRWTAPAAVAGPVWFNLGFVASNEDAMPGGDGVTMVRHVLHAAGAALDTRPIAQGCTIARGARPAQSWQAWGGFLLVAGVLGFLRFRRRMEVE